MQQTTQVTIRKAPKFLSFFFVGAIVGAISSVLVWLASLPNTPVNGAPIIGYLFIVFTIVGAGLGLVAALVADRISRARSHTLEATKLVGSAPKRRSKPAPKP